jgi:hypothetical protein
MDMQITAKEEGITVEMPITLIGDVQPPDRMHGMMTMSFLGITIETEIINIGDTSYIKDPETGEWEASTEPAAPYTPGDFTGVEPDEIKGLKLVGKKTLNGSEVYLLKGTISTAELGDTFEGTASDLQVKYWIGVNNGRLEQSQVKGQIPMPDTEGGVIDLNATTTYSKYGKSVTINPP